MSVHTSVDQEVASYILHSSPPPSNMTPPLKFLQLPKASSPDGDKYSDTLGHGDISDTLARGNLAYKLTLLHSFAPLQQMKALSCLLPTLRLRAFQPNQSVQS